MVKANCLYHHTKHTSQQFGKLQHKGAYVLSSLKLPRIAVEPGKKHRWSGPNDASMALAIAELAEQYPHPVMVIADQFKQMDQLRHEIHFFQPALPVLTFPDLETLPYDHFSAHPDIISRRMDCLYRLPHLQQGIVIVPITTLMHRLPPRAWVASRSLVVHQGQKLDRDKLIHDLEASYYHQVNTVMTHGEYALRGSMIDLFPMGSKLPYRIDLFDDSIDSLRTFDPETQKTLEKIHHIDLLPALEFPLDATGIKQFQHNWNQNFPGEARQSQVYKSFSSGQMYPGGEYYMPLFFPQCASLFAYLPTSSLIFSTNQLEHYARPFYQETLQRYQNLAIDQTRPVLPVTQLFLSPQDIFTELRAFTQISYALPAATDTHTDPVMRTDHDVDMGIQHSATTAAKPGKGFCLDNKALPELVTQNRQQPLSALKNFISQHPEHHMLFCAEGSGRMHALQDLLQRLLAEVEPKAQLMVVADWQDFMYHCQTETCCYAITDRPIERSLWLNACVLLTEAQLFIHSAHKKRRKSKSLLSEHVIKHLAELSPGDPVVHIEHGIGRFQGLHMLETDQQRNEFLLISYAEDARLYVPVSSLHLINRYTGVDAEQVQLSRLGSGQWEKQKEKARKKILDAASILLDIYAQRAQKQGYAFRMHTEDYQRFASQFAFILTEDQEQAIEAVMADMQAPRLMDRLICGDVGFGKTEVALRACFIAINDGKQAILLVPTTLLAQQHFETFSDRFADWPIEVAVLSRFKTGKQQTQILAQFQEGKIDLLIGTHKLLQNSISTEKLGLLVIDEEHRFGVKQKEKLKALKADVDILSLTATPIPRTLNMAMSGLRDLSIISTPPDNRLTVRTFLHQNDQAITKEAILRELLRGGQVYLLHNDIKTIQIRADEIQKLVPEARIAVAHGQMLERQLEKTMSDFYHNRYNLLVCTTIIETGIDIPNANTMIIDRADKFGLAQLHQLRGRVGRSHHQAYAYLFVPDMKALQGKAEKRLEAICQAEDLGSGFILATQDMEIRGAGALLGEEQSGHMQMIGFDLYMQLLAHAISSMQAAGKKTGGTMKNMELDLEQAMRQGCEAEFMVSATLPADYVQDIPTRLTYYKRIANCMEEEELDAIRMELIDRFGLLPEETQNLFAIAEIRQRAFRLGMIKIQVDHQTGKISFADQPQVKPEQVLALIQNNPQNMRITASNQFVFQLETTSDAPMNPIAQVQKILDALTG